MGNPLFFTKSSISGKRNGSKTFSLNPCIQELSDFLSSFVDQTILKKSQLLEKTQKFGRCETGFAISQGDFPFSRTLVTQLRLVVDGFTIWQVYLYKWLRYNQQCRRGFQRSPSRVNLSDSWQFCTQSRNSATSGLSVLHTADVRCQEGRLILDGSVSLRSQTHSVTEEVLHHVWANGFHRQFMGEQFGRRKCGTPFPNGRLVSWFQCSNPMTRCSVLRWHPWDGRAGGGGVSLDTHRRFHPSGLTSTRYTMSVTLILEGIGVPPQEHIMNFRHPEVPLERVWGAPWNRGALKSELACIPSVKVQCSLVDKTCTGRMAHRACHTQLDHQLPERWVDFRA